MVAHKRKESTRRIEQILRERGSSLAEDVAKVDDVRQIPRPLREQIVDELGEEFSGKGLGPDGEPNTYGLEIEDLTDACALAWDKEDLH